MAPASIKRSPPYLLRRTVGMDLSLTAQLTIVFTALLASIGTAAVPGAGIIMLVIILESVGVPNAGIALILSVDRILDMCRTVTNITGGCDGRNDRGGERRPAAGSRAGAGSQSGTGRQ